jgi:hypothetical protein
MWSASYHLTEETSRFILSTATKCFSNRRRAVLKSWTVRCRKLQPFEEIFENDEPR